MHLYVPTHVSEGAPPTISTKRIIDDKVSIDASISDDNDVAVCASTGIHRIIDDNGVAVNVSIDASIKVSSDV